LTYAAAAAAADSLAAVNIVDNSNRTSRPALDAASHLSYAILQSQSVYVTKYMRVAVNTPSDAVRQHHAYRH